MRKGRTWASFQDEKVITEANAKKAMNQNQLEEELKQHAKIKEAAAVFTHEGFNLLLDGLGGIVAKRIQPELEKILDRKLGELLEGMKEGAQQALMELQAAPTVEVKEAPDNDLKPELNTGAKGNPAAVHSKWSIEEDTYLADTILRYVREGRTLSDAIEIVAENTGRTVSATNYRWYAVVKERYKDELQEALRERRGD